jgi:hypothetical protein
MERRIFLAGTFLQFKRKEKKRKETPIGVD